MSSPGERFREMLSDDGVLVVPGAMNALLARLVERNGFGAVYLSGAGVANGLLGRPDVGLVTQTELSACAGYMTSAVSIPVLADADTGFGNELNVARTVELFESAGVAGIQLEDQVAPKRCGHMAGKQVVAPDEMCARLESALSARRDPSTVIVARTDARATHGLDEAIARCRLYSEVGADVLFVEAPQSVEELERIGRELSGHLLLANIVEGGTTPLLSAGELAALGFKIALFPGMLTRVCARATDQALAILAAEGDSRSLLDRMMLFDELQEVVGVAAPKGAAR